MAPGQSVSSACRPPRPDRSYRVARLPAGLVPGRRRPADHVRARMRLEPPAVDPAARRPRPIHAAGCTTPLGRSRTACGSRATRSRATTKPSSRSSAGPAAGAVGGIPLIVRERRLTAPAVLVQVPVNTWEAYNPWGGKSLYGSGQTHATEVSFDRPYDQQEFHDMGTAAGAPLGPVPGADRARRGLPDRRGHRSRPGLAAKAPVGVLDRPRRVLDAADA